MCHCDELLTIVVLALMNRFVHGRVPTAVFVANVSRRRKCLLWSEEICYRPFEHFPVEVVNAKLVRRTFSRQWKTLIPSTNVNKKSLETEFLLSFIVRVCRLLRAFSIAA